MSIRPVDMQLVVPKTIDYSKQHQSELNKQGLDQQTFAQIAAKEAERKQTVVVETNDSDHTVNKDKQERNNQKGKGRGKKNSQNGENSDENNKNSKSSATGLFDVRI